MGACDGCGTPEDVRQDNHIHVHLDFVPVTERLPEISWNKGVAALLCFPGGTVIIEARGNIMYCGAAAGWVYDGDPDDSIRHQWGDDVELTHWSEIPTIEERG